MTNDAISTRMPAVTVEYDCRGERTKKTFGDAVKARRFFTTKEKDGKNPVVLKAEEESESGGNRNETTADSKAIAEKETEKPKKMRVSKGRPFSAGQVIAETGLERISEDGITDEMVARVDELTGKPNPTESEAWLRIAWNVINGTKEVSKSGGTAAEKKE